MAELGSLLLAEENSRVVLCYCKKSSSRRIHQVMAKSFGLVLLLALLIQLPMAAESALLNMPCSSSSPSNDCTVANSICGPLSSMCTPYGTYCQCKVGYRAVAGRCQPEVKLGSPCTAEATICVDEHAVCNQATGKCDCDIDYVVSGGDGASRCVAAESLGSLGDSCSSDETCGEHLECVDGTCTCMSGYFFDDNLMQCSQIGLGDSCMTQDDCFHVLRAMCHPDRLVCACPDGYSSQPITYRQEFVIACVANSAPPRQIGEQCVETGNARSYCKQPYLCSKCTPNASISLCTGSRSIDSVTTAPVTATTPVALKTTPQSSSPVSRAGTPTTTPVNFDYNEGKSTTKRNTPPFSTPNRKPITTMKTTPKNSVTTAASVNVTIDVYDYLEGVETTPKSEGATTPAAPEVLLGAVCKSSSECTPYFSACLNNTCSCMEGFVRVGANECREQFEQIPLGMSCTAADTCATPKAECFNSTCQCRQGFKTGPNKDDCIESTRKFAYDDTCSKSSECYYNLLCIQSKCQCSPGYKKTSAYGCKKRSLGDECLTSANIECRFVQNGRCSDDRRCVCADGFTRQNRTNCVPLQIEQDIQSFVTWTVPCKGDEDCFSAAAPVLSRCLQPTMICGCPPASTYDSKDNRCRYSAPSSDRGFGCWKDADCPRGSPCIANTCGGPQAIMIRAGAVSPTSSTLLLVLPSILAILSASCRQ